MAKKKREQESFGIKWSGKIRFKEERAPDRGHAQSTAASVPLVGVHEKYQFIEIYPGCFCKSYWIGNNNYLTAPEEEQMTVYKGWQTVLNSFGNDMEASLTVYNRTINMQEYCEKAMYKETGDGFDDFRKELNEITMQRISEGRNGIQRDKYLNVAVHAHNAIKAARVFHRLDQDLDKTMNRFGSSAVPVSLEESLDILYGIYNDPKEHLVQKSKVLNENGRLEEITSFQYDHMRSMGLTINDVIGPTSFEVKRDHLQMGMRLARTLRVSKLANKMNDEFLNNVTDMNFNCITTINLKAIAPKKADAIVAKNLSFVRDLKRKQMQTGQKAGVYDDSYVSPEVMDREVEALALRDAIRGKDERLFDTTMTVTVFADSKEQLEEYTDILVTEYKKASFTLSVMNGQQEEGFNSTLPLCYNQIAETRTLTTSSLALFIPFSTLELNDPEGINYSCNLLSKNPIFYDRMKGVNYNGFIFGGPGTGKSFAAKWAALCQFLKSNDAMFIVDPENEYDDMAEALNGQVIVITPGGSNHINPMAIYVSEDYDSESDPVNEKASSILQIMECVVKSPFGINSIQETIIDECVHALYEPFMVNGRLRKISDEEMPTLTDLRVELSKRKEPEARELVYSLKLYTGDGSLSVFGHHTNVEITNRLVVFQIRDVGERLKNLAIMVILEHIWNEIVKNRKIGRTTHYLLDEIYLLFQNEYSANRLNTMVRRGRKYGAVFTGISQNVTPILESSVARDMLQNCTFIQILGQATPDRESLKHILNLSKANAEYITNSPPGQGLIYTGKNVIPFSGNVPKDTKVYRLLTSNPRERREYELERQREEARKQKEAKEIA